LQEWADQRIFDSRWTLRVVATIGVGAFVTACFVGTLELQSAVGSSFDRTVALRRAEGSSPTVAALSGTLRLPEWTTFWAPVHLRVKVSGYPEVEATVRPWTRTTLVAPDSFFRPVVVLKPDKDVLQMLVNNPMTLVVPCNGVPASGE